MKVIDKNGRLFGIISIIDVVVIIVVVLLAAGIYIRFFSLETTAAVGQPSEPINYSLKIGGVRQYTVDALAVGDKLFNQKGTEELGTVTGVRAESCRQWGAKADGTAVYGTVEGLYDLYLTVEGSGIISDGRFYVGRIVEMGVNQSASFVTKYSTFTGTVTEIGAA